MRRGEADTLPEPPKSSIQVRPDIYRGQRIGKYEVVSLLTMGGMAELFLAFTAGPGGFRKYVVIKRILPDVRSDEEFVKMFLDEARLTAAFNHPNIAQVYDLGEEEDGLYLAMEFIPGQNVNQVTAACVKRATPLPVGFSCRVARDVCEALQYAHTFADPTGRPFPIIHRDVAQKNVMVTYDGLTKLLDFGIAKAKRKLGRTHIGMVKGTTGYMSPEQVRGDKIDGRSDLFSVGVMLHEMVTGQRLFSAPTEGEEMTMILSAPIPNPKELVPALPTELSNVILRALARDRADRFASARELAKALERAAGKLLYEQEQASAFMKELFDSRLKATQALLQSVGGQMSEQEVSAALKLIGEDAGSTFPDAKVPGSLTTSDSGPRPPQRHASDELAVVQAMRTEQAGEMPERRFSGVFVASVLIGVAAVGFALYRYQATAPESKPQAEKPDPHPPLGPVPMLKPFPEKGDPHAPAPATGPAAPVAAVVAQPAPAKPDAGHRAATPSGSGHSLRNGTLTLVTTPECEVFLRNNSLGRTPLFNATVPEGTHLLRLRGPDGKVHLLSVPIKADKGARFRFALADLPLER